ncbi:MAG: hypothetical protein EHM63_10095, partial [Actinobacteria bacterium]
ATFEAHIAAPVAEVFAFLAEVTNTPRWRDRMDEVSWINRDRTFKVISSFGPWRRMEMRGEVTANEPDHRFAYRITEGPLKARNEYVVGPDGEGTSLRMTGSTGMDGWVMRLVGPIVAMAYTRTTRKELERLKQILA